MQPQKEKMIWNAEISIRRRLKACSFSNNRKGKVAATDHESKMCYVVPPELQEKVADISKRVHCLFGLTPKHVGKQ